MIIFQPTCAHARWALMCCLASVCLSICLTRKKLTRIHQLRWWPTPGFPLYFSQNSPWQMATRSLTIGGAPNLTADWQRAPAVWLAWWLTAVKVFWWDQRNSRRHLNLTSFSRCALPSSWQLFCWHNLRWNSEVLLWFLTEIQWIETKIKRDLQVNFLRRLWTISRQTLAEIQWGNI